MSKNRKPNTILEGVTIEAIAAEGKCLFHHDNYVVFVPFAYLETWPTLRYTEKSTATPKVAYCDSSRRAKCVPSHFANISAYVAAANGKTCLTRSN